MEPWQRQLTDPRSQKFSKVFVTIIILGFAVGAANYFL